MRITIDQNIKNMINVWIALNKHVIIIIITTLLHFEHFIDRSISQSKWETWRLQMHLQPAKRNDLVKAVHYLATRSDDNLH